MITKEHTQVAINFLFPEVSMYSIAYEKISEFIESEFKRLGTSVLYFRNKEFVKLLHFLSLEIGYKEVIITKSNVRATNNFHDAPRVIWNVPVKKKKNENNFVNANLKSY